MSMANRNNYRFSDMQNSPNSYGLEPMDSVSEQPSTYYTLQNSSSTASYNAESLPLPPYECSSGFQSASSSSFPSTLPSSASTTINEYPPQGPPQPRHLTPVELIREFEGIINGVDKYDKLIFGSFSVTLYMSTMYKEIGQEVYRLAAKSPVILNTLYVILTDDIYKDDYPILITSIDSLWKISKSDLGCAAILGCTDSPTNQSDQPSRGVQALINSLQSRDNTVVLLAIGSVHNLLLDPELQEIAKRHIKDADGIKYIVRQLINPDVNLVNNYEFKQVVLDCLQILAYRNTENRIKILESDGPKMLLQLIGENIDLLTQPFGQPSIEGEELINDALRVLKSLSVCPSNKLAIIRANGIEILTRCIKLDNQKILRTCLWTLRNLSDVIANTGLDFQSFVDQLLKRLLELISDRHFEDPCIVTCALGALANITCNNEPVKQYICDCNGVEALLRSVELAFLKDLTTFGSKMSLSFRLKDILEPALCALCHLANQSPYQRLEEEMRRVKQRLMSLRYSQQGHRSIQDLLSCPYYDQLTE